jgi:hypothetical protein
MWLVVASAKGGRPLALLLIVPLVAKNMQLLLLKKTYLSCL